VRFWNVELASQLKSYIQRFLSLSSVLNSLNSLRPGVENIQANFHFFGSQTIGYARNPSLKQHQLLCHRRVHPTPKNSDAKLVYLIGIIKLPCDNLPPYVAFFATDFNEPIYNL
jgi:hypothetical protein